MEILFNTITQSGKVDNIAPGGSWEMTGSSMSLIHLFKGCFLLFA